MRFEGNVSSCNDERGFGYIESTQGGEPVFVHISAWPRGAGRPQPKQRVSFEVEVGPQGRRARNVQFLQTRRPRPRSENAVRAQWGTATLFAVPAFVLLCLLVAVLWRPPLWIAGLYVAASAAAFAAYAADKSAATSGVRRVPESTLHVLAVACGWPGALLAQQVLRHKSTKPAFRQVFWATVTIHVAAFVVVASPLGRRFLSAP